MKKKSVKVTRLTFALIIVVIIIAITQYGYIKSYCLLFLINMDKENNYAPKCAYELAKTHAGINICINNYSKYWGSSTGGWLECAIRDATDKDYAIAQLRKSIINKDLTPKHKIPHLWLLWYITGNQNYLKKAYSLSCQLASQANTKHFLLVSKRAMLWFVKSEAGRNIIRQKYDEKTLWQMDPNDFVRIMTMEDPQNDLESQMLNH